MKKCFILLLLTAVLAGLCMQAFALSGFANFEQTAVYSDNFEDVDEEDWYFEDVKAAYELGLIRGKSETQFDPDGNMTLAEAITLACRLHSVFTAADAEFSAEGAWYQPYVDYAEAQGILAIDADREYDAKIRRGEFAQIFYKAFPQEGLAEINRIECGAIPDVHGDEAYGEAVYALYRAGVLSGNDESGSFAPKSSIKRGEVAAILTRMVMPEQRIPLTLEIPEQPSTEDGAEEPSYVYHEKIPILMYHEVDDAQLNELYISVRDFESHLRYFEEAGISPISMQQLWDHWVNQAPLPEKPIVLTFDDGYRTMYTTVYPMLKERGWSGTFYCISDTRWSKEFLTAEMIWEMAAGGMEIGSHTKGHFQLTALSEKEAQEQITGSKEILASIAEQEVTQFCYPAGRHNDAVAAAVEAAGYRCAVTTLQGFAEEAQGLFKLRRLRIVRGMTAETLASMLSLLAY